jgi:hypothetical protein
MVKQIGLTLIALLFVSGCGGSEQGQGASAEDKNASMNSGVMQVETQKAKEQHASTPEKDETISASASEMDSAPSTAAQESSVETEKSGQRSNVLSGDEPTPERTSILSIEMDNKYGKVKFNHAAHTQFIACSTCHPTDPPSRIEMSRKEFHAVCRTCHHEMGAGPLKCSSCHEH